MKEFSRVNENKIIVKEGRIEEEKGDAALNWTFMNLTSGPESFYRLHKKAGAQLHSATILMQGHVEPCDVFSTIAGMLDFYLVLHAVLADKRLSKASPSYTFNLTMYNILNTLLEYKRKGNVCRNIYITFPDTTTRKELINSILLYEDKMYQFAFIFITETKEEYKEVVDYLEEKTKKKSLYNIWKDFINKRIWKKNTGSTIKLLKNSQRLTAK